MFTTRSDSENLFLENGKQSDALGKLNSVPSSDYSVCFQLQDFSDDFEVKINDLEVSFPIFITYTSLYFALSSDIWA